jgi:hypothetical protein
VISVTACFPLEVLKTRMQIQVSKQSDSVFAYLSFCFNNNSHG